MVVTHVGVCGAHMDKRGEGWGGGESKAREGGNVKDREIREGREGGEEARRGDRVSYTLTLTVTDKFLSTISSENNGSILSEVTPTGISDSPPTRAHGMASAGTSLNSEGRGKMASKAMSRQFPKST